MATAIAFTQATVGEFAEFQHSGLELAQESDFQPSNLPAIKAKKELPAAAKKFNKKTAVAHKAAMVKMQKARKVMMARINKARQAHIAAFKKQMARKMKACKNAKCKVNLNALNARFNKF
jgi:hypothetical protein